MGIGNPQIIARMRREAQERAAAESAAIAAGQKQDPVKAVQEKYGSEPLTATGRKTLQAAYASNVTGVTSPSEDAAYLESAYKAQQAQIQADQARAEYRAKAGAVGATSEAVKQQTQQTQKIKAISSGAAELDPNTGGLIYKVKISDSVNVSSGTPQTEGGGKTVKINISDSVQSSEGVPKESPKDVNEIKIPKEQIERVDYQANVGSDFVTANIILKEEGQQPETQENKIYPWIRESKQEKKYVFGEATLNVLKESAASFLTLQGFLAGGFLKGIEYLENVNEKLNDQFETGEVTSSSLISQGLSGQPLTGSGRGLAYDVESIAAETGLFLIPLKKIPLPLRPVKFEEGSVLVFGTRSKLIELATISKGKIVKGLDIKTIGESLKKEIPTLKEKANRPTEFEFFGTEREAIIIKDKNLASLVSSGYITEIEAGAIRGGKTIMKETKGLPDVVRRESFPEQITETIPKGEPTIKTIEFLQKSKSVLQGSFIDLFTNIKKYQYLPSDIDFVIKKPKEGVKLAKQFLETTEEAFKKSGMKLEIKSTGKGSTQIFSGDKKLIEFVYKGETGEGLGELSKTGRVFGQKLPTGSFEREGVKIKKGRFQTGRMTASALSLEVESGQIKVIASRVKDFPKQFMRSMSEAETAREIGLTSKAEKIEEGALDIRKLGEQYIDYEGYIKSRQFIDELPKTLEVERLPTWDESLSVNLGKGKDPLLQSSLIESDKSFNIKKIEDYKDNEINKNKISLQKEFKKSLSDIEIKGKSPPVSVASRSINNNKSLSYKPSSNLSKISLSKIKSSIPSSNLSEPSLSKIEKSISKSNLTSRPPSTPTSRPPSTPTSRPPSTPTGGPPSKPTGGGVSSLSFSSKRKMINLLTIKQKPAGAAIYLKSTYRKGIRKKIPPRKEFIGNVPLTKVEGYYFKKSDISYKKPEQKAMKDIKKATRQVKADFGKGLKSIRFKKLSW